jgi:hypothetical protein
MYDNICKKLHKELKRLDEKYASENIEVSMADLEVFDKISHALKSMATYEAMIGEEPEGSQMSMGGNSMDRYSYRRGRDAMGRYTSRDYRGDVEQGRSGGYYEPVPMYERRY